MKNFLKPLVVTSLLFGTTGSSQAQLAASTSVVQTSPVEKSLFESDSILHIKLSGNLRDLMTDKGENPQNHPVVISYADASGKELWSGTTGGTATRFGRSYKANNYYETLSDSLIEATYSLITNRSFHDALAK